MPEHLRALIVILALATGVFLFAKAPACALATTAGDYERRRNLWFAITLTAFLANDFWIYIIVTATLLLFALPREPNKLAMFFLVLLAVPPIPKQIPGLGPIEHLFTIDYLRMLALAVLLPAFLALRKKPDVERFGQSIPDKLIAGYIILNFLLMLTSITFTNALRHGVLYQFTDIFLPYYVASRSLRNLQAFRDALMAFVIGALVLSAIGVFENTRHWLLYESLERSLGRPWSMGNYLHRDVGGVNLRALGATGHPIALGYVMAVAAGLVLYLRKSVSNTTTWGLGLAALIIGLIAPMSRGPWVGAAAMLLVFVSIGASAGARLSKLGLLGAIALPILLVTPMGETIVNHLPFVGTVQAENVTYRQQLLEISLEVIMQNPFFGAPDVLSLPVMQQLRQGEGIIDVVNSYIGVALTTGLVGFSLYSGFFIAVSIAILGETRKLTNRSDEHYLLGQALLSTLLGILVMIGTVSSIGVIPVIYWSVAGLGVAYARMLAHARSQERTPKTARPPRFQEVAGNVKSGLKYRDRGPQINADEKGL